MLQESNMAVTRRHTLVVAGSNLGKKVGRFSWFRSFQAIGIGFAKSFSLRSSQPDSLQFQNTGSFMKLDRVRVAMKTACLLSIPLLGARDLSAAPNIQDLGVTVSISGEVSDMSNQTWSQGMAFQVFFRDIGYTGKVTRVLLERKADEQLTVWVGLRELTVTIRNTTISGRRHRANCGPLQVVMGNQDVAWLALQVKCDHANHEIQLLPDRTQFGFTPDNWSIGSPSWVKASGIGMTQSRVVAGLRDGLAAQRTEFERQIIDVAPTIFETVVTHVEQHLEEEVAAAR